MCSQPSRKKNLNSAFGSDFQTFGSQVSRKLLSGFWLQFLLGALRKSCFLDILSRSDFFLAPLSVKSALRPEDAVLIRSQKNQKRFIEVYSFYFALADGQSLNFFFGRVVSV